MNRLLSRPLLTLAVLCVALSGCGSDTRVLADDPTTTTPAETSVADEDASVTADDEAATPTYPLDIEGLNGTTTIESRPERIVSLSPSATEMLFAIGAGDQVVAVDSLSTFPPETPVTDLSAFEPNLEAISAFEPDLVIVSFDPENALTDAFGLLGVPVLLQGSALTVDDTYDQITQLGLVTDHASEAASENEKIRTRIDAAVASVEQRTGEPVRIYHELDDTFFSVSSASFVGDVYRRLGFENVADPADPDGYGYPQVTPELLIEADPTLIVITDQVGYGIDDVAVRPGWDVITAVKTGNIVQVDADIASRWGPRVADFAEQMAGMAS